jgi:hypothetical protein
MISYLRGGSGGFHDILEYLAADECKIPEKHHV